MAVMVRITCTTWDSREFYEKCAAIRTLTGVISLRWILLRYFFWNMAVKYYKYF